ncbi:MAG TPA: pyrroloquinoline quinone-dependent dehydrogenase [Candidatus Acidoferrum sp.]|nr:pyrroloquinoline quinone-dependent dehydrogenase [Candidatus Acidoferrum sp.]
MITAQRSNFFRNVTRIAISSFALCAFLAPPQTRAQSEGWPAYGGDPGGTRYSTASQINKSNVAQLKVAWTFRTGAFPHDPDLDKKAAFESTPILIDGTLFLTTPYDHVFAVNPQTGEKLWEFDPKLELPYGASEVTSRGVSAWRDPRAKANEPCALRIFFGTLDARLIALDGESGKLCADFGSDGEIDLTSGVKLRDPGDYQVTSAPAIAGDVVITGSSIGDNRAVTLERGIVRAFDARTGKLRWSWDPIPWALKTTPRTGAGNAWSTLSVDPERNLVFIPTGSASPDYFGGYRKGDNKWANSVVALKAATGEFVWGFQVVHHDIWDYDVASQPALFTWKNKIPAIAITTKMGRVFVLNRLTGVPLFPVEEVPVPKSDIPGEESWPSQPSGISLVPETLSPDDAWGPTPELQQWCKEQIKSARSGSIFTPPSTQGTLVYPSNVGGVNWGSSAYDPASHLLIVNTNRLPILVRMIPREQLDAARKRASDLDRLHGEFARQTGAPFAMFRTPLLSSSGLPCNAPPWGTILAVDLFTGKKVWDVPLGTFIPGQKTGTVTLGGPIVTAGGLVFSASTMDNKIYAFDSATGAELWSFELPAGGQATPMTYTAGGKQYLVIAAGGHGKLGTKQGDFLLAFTLP